MSYFGFFPYSFVTVLTLLARSIFFFPSKFVGSVGDGLHLIGRYLDVGLWRTFKTIREFFAGAGHSLAVSLGDLASIDFNVMNQPGQRWRETVAGYLHIDPGRRMI